MVVSHIQVIWKLIPCALKLPPKMQIKWTDSVNEMKRKSDWSKNQISPLHKVAEMILILREMDTVQERKLCRNCLTFFWKGIYSKKKEKNTLYHLVLMN